MKKTIKIQTLILILIFLSTVVYSQDTTSFLNQVSNNLECYQKQKTPEKIYLHLDKTMYKQADNIWFNVFLTNGITNMLNPVSNIVYVELINPKGQVQEQKILILNDGTAGGNFFINNNEKGGLFKIKAYTNWMQNFDDSPIFEKEIIIQKVITPAVLLKLDFDKESYGAGQNVVADLELKNLKNKAIPNYPVSATVYIDNNEYKKIELNTDDEGKLDINFSLPTKLSTTDVLINVLVNYAEKTESISRSVPVQLNNIDLMFFPEGGDLLEATTNNLAFQALNEFGLPTDIEGVILDNDNNIVQNFGSYHQGMGVFNFKPEKNKTYKAQIIKPVKLDTLFDLPKAYDFGFSLIVNKINDKNIELDVFSKSEQKSYLMVTIRDKEYYKQEINLQEGNNKIEIPTKNFTDGIVRITLFDQNKLPHCERLVYYGELSPLEIELKLKKEDYAIEEETKLEIISKQNGKAISAKLSLSIVDEKNLTFADDKQDNILSWFLMSSELKGEIYEPSFYFDKKEIKAKKALDLVLMTHGWRRFKWKEILNIKPEISYAAEQQRNVAGRITIKKNGKPVRAKVWLFEKQNNKRASHLTSAKDGYFLFKNVDPTSDLQLIAKYKNKKAGKLNIQILDNDSIPSSLLTSNNGNFTPLNIEGKTNPSININNFDKNQENIIDGAIIKEGDQIKNVNNVNDKSSLGDDFMDFEDKEIYLQNVVVSGIGISKSKKKQAISVQVLQEDRSALNALSGKIPGVSISNASGAAGSSTRVIFRGYSTFYGVAQPLYVINGVPVDTYSESNMLINPENIETITFLKGASATALYGSRAANGVIHISTYTNNNFGYNNIQYKKNFHENIILNKLIQTSNNEFDKEFYYNKNYWKNRNKQESTNSTVFWKNNITTDENGKATVEFYCPDDVSSYRIVTEGISSEGGIGRAEKNINVIKPVNIESKIPYELSFNDTVSVPVIITNSTKKTINGSIHLLNSVNLQAITSVNSKISIAPNSSEKQIFELRVLPVQSTETIKIVFYSYDNQYTEQINRDIEITAKGFPVAKSFSSDQKNSNYSFNIEKPLTGSITGSFNIYPSILDDIMSGIKSIIRVPHGCFEQVSASCYPNILALKYIRENNIVDYDFEKRALEYIDIGYHKLVAYETSQHGFEWYGGLPPHTGLTAMGLLQFIEMQTVYQGVDNNLVKRSKQWLLDRREGDGNFKNSQGKYSYSGASQEVTNAYTIYALAKCKVFDIEKEYQLAKNEAIKSKDAYRLALMANSAFYLNKSSDFTKLLDILTNQVKEVGLGKIPVSSTITRSYGNSAQIETASLYLMALLNKTQKQVAEIQEIVSFLNSKRNGGYFGSTQGTVLALTALTEYAKYFKKSKNDVNFQIVINDNTITKQLKYADLNSFSIDLEKYIVKGEQNIEIKFLSKETISYSFDFEWNTLKLEQDENCKIALTTNLESKQINEAGIVRMNIEIENTSNNGVPMTIAEIGIPAGLSLQPWQLQELSKKETFDYYEIFDGKFVVYYREMLPNEKRIIKLDLKADIVGTYTAPASSAYLYYTSEHKNWQEGTKIIIKN